MAPPLQTSLSSSKKGSSRRPISPSATASVQVVVRVRPLNDRERKHGTLPVVSASTSDKTVTVIKGSGSRQIKSSYKFDNVFTSFSTQEDVFEATLQPIIRDVLNGYESTVFAYGQTGTGKTHTMEGDLSNVQQHGVIPRSAAAIFDALKKDPDYVSSTVYCSLLEIYNEELSDLLVDRSTKRGIASATPSRAPKLAIMEGENGPFCRGLSESKVTSAEDLLALMQKAHQQRKTGETDMNKESSRSHCIFTLRVVAKRRLIDGSLLEVGGKLHCVDLAGSECAKSCGNAGQQQAARERERMNINRSLLTLGRVVKLLKEKSEKPSSFNSVRIPYRDSKLTRILQESLGGRCKTCLIATISPSVTAIEESMSTLNYAQAANGIINKPITTSLMSVGGYDNKSPKEEGASGAGSSVEHWHEMECRLEYMQSQVDEAQQALARKHIQHQEFLERAEKAELAQELAERKYEKATHDISVLENKVEDVTQKLEKSEKSLKETKILLGATQQTEVCLTDEATTLIEVIKTTITDGDRMHQSLLEKRQEDVDRKAATQEYQRTQMKLLNGLLKNLRHVGQQQEKHRMELESANDSYKSRQLELLKTHSTVVEELKEGCILDIESLKTSIRDGVLPVFRTLTSSSKEKLNTLSAKLADGEANVLSQCQTVLDRLVVNSERISEIESSYKSKSNDVLATLSTHLEDSKKSLSETVAAITVALQKANAVRQLRREALKKSIVGFQDHCNESLDEMAVLSKTHTDNMNQSIQSIKDGRESRSDILQTMSDLDKLLEKKKNDHVQKLERQLSILTNQHKALVILNHKQQQMNKSMMSNVMNGVRSLIESEMQTIDDFQSQNFRSLTEVNEESKAYNEHVIKMTRGTFEHLGSINTQLNSNIQQNFGDQVQLCADLEAETSKFDENMTSVNEAIRTPVERFCLESTSSLEKAEAEDRNATDDIIGKTKTFIEEATNKLTSGIQEGVEDGISNLEKSTADGFKYVREQVIEPVRTDLVANIQSHQKRLNDDIQADIAATNSKIEEGENSVVEESNKGLELISVLEQRLETSANETFASTIDNHKEFIQGSRWLENATEAQSQNITSEVSKSLRLVSSSTGCLEEFTHDVIMVQEETPEIRERDVPVYSEHLTSTDKPEIILRQAGLGGDNEPCDKENDTNQSETKAPQKESSLPPPSSKLSVLMDRSGSVNSANAVDTSPPLKRAVERTKSGQSNLPKRSSKRVKTRQR